jgi:hypothetical protein
VDQPTSLQLAVLGLTSPEPAEAQLSQLQLAVLQLAVSGSVAGPQLPVLQLAVL